MITSVPAAGDAALASTDQCCTHDCDQGRKCPRRFDRRTGFSASRYLFGWLMRENRSGWDRRQREDMGEMK